MSKADNREPTLMLRRSAIIAASPLSAVAGKELRERARAAGSPVSYRRRSSLACFLRWSMLGRSGKRGIQTSMHEIADDPQNRLHKGSLLQKQSVSKWVQPFPRGGYRSNAVRCP